MENQPLAAAALDYLCREGTVVVIPAGEVIIRRGEPGAAVYVLLEGLVEVRLRTADGGHLTLATLGPGELFGELSVLRGAPANADVRTVEDVRVLRYPAERFPAALAECAPLRDHLLSNLAERMHDTTAGAWDLYRKAEGFTALARPDLNEDAMVAATARMRSIKGRLEVWAKAQEPLVIAGAPGTGKRLAARLVHRWAGLGGGAQITFGCREVPAGQVHDTLFGISMTGHATVGGSGCFGAIHLAHGGSLLLTGLDTLLPAEQARLANYLRERRETGGALFPDVLVIGTVQRLTENGSPEGLLPALLEEIPNAVELPPLAQRPREILPLARHFLAKLPGNGPAPALAKDAELALVDMRYEHANVEELRQVVELAAACRSGDEIRAEHIMAAPEEAEPAGRSLGRPRWLIEIVAGRGLHWTRTIVLAGFLGAILFCLAAPASPAGLWSNTFVWSIWEPVIFGLFLLAGALWCTICPLSHAGRLASRLGSLGLPPPRWLRGRGDLWIPAAGFVAILAAERVFHMTGNPRATALMLLCLIFGAIVLGLLLERETWCRHLCPLGRLAVSLAPAAPLFVAADRKRCASTCTTHECFKGSAEGEGCPVFHHPLMVSEAHHCKLCGDCLSTCPHASTTPWIRPPLSGAWRLRGSGSYPAAFAYVLLLAAPLFMATAGHPDQRRPLLLGALFAGALAAGLLASRAFPAILGLRTTGRSDLEPRIAAALAVLAWGPLMAEQLANIPLLSTLRLSTAAGSSLPLILLAQPAVILLATLFAAVIFWRMQAGPGRTHSLPLPSRLALGLLLAGYTATVLALLH